MISVINTSEAVGLDGTKYTRVVAGERGHERTYDVTPGATFVAALYSRYSLR